MRGWVPVHDLARRSSWVFLACAWWGAGEGGLGYPARASSPSAPFFAWAGQAPGRAVSESSGPLPVLQGCQWAYQQLASLALDST